MQKKYICYSYAGDDTHCQPLVKKVKTYHPVIFKCYKSYVADDVKEVSIRNHVNVLKHPIFFIIPVVFGVTLYLFFGHSSFATGDLFGTKKVMHQYTEQKENPELVKPEQEQQQVEMYTSQITKITGEDGTVKYTNR